MAATTASARAIEATFDFLKWIAIRLGGEPTVIHVPARPNRQAQLEEFDALTRLHSSNRRIVVRTTLPDSELVCWPAEKWQVSVPMNGGTISAVTAAAHHGTSPAENTPPTKA